MANSSTFKRVRLGALLVGSLALVVGACASEDPSGGGDAGPVKVGVVTSQSGLLSAYGEQFTQGFKAGIDYATDGTGEVDGRKLDIEYADDGTDPAKATAAVTSMVGKGTQIITGPVSSGVAVQVAPLAEQNQFLYISGSAATDAITGINDYTFRSGRQTYQDVVTSARIVGDLNGKKVVVFAQDYEFGQANVAAVKAVLGEEQGADVVPVLAPVDATDLTPFARQVIDEKPDLVFAAWAGETTNAMWQSLSQQGVFDDTVVVTGLADRASFDSFGPAAQRIDFVSHYFAEASDNEPNKALVSYLEGENVKADIFHNDGFVAAQLVVRAVREGGDDVNGMIEALEGWEFTGPKGQQRIREEDHAMLQPMFTASLTGEVGALTPELGETLAAEDIAPPVASE
ncbi:branched-chain amino acid transport system substrate-binding protein [Saccharomonospora amisosensis]|uniref:Branched-chain amino acid transport system substrate-binding protein n=1 Tax=Saccharomonospora amisosensis TaxID=1128677 RepID=A0A7X5ULW6_9PSEU|nr:substrate-binding domain-containing protein [Saccharomonospora amisosensis]NIJ10427.1 branched-chain amino acid transport system substrate-binding protein [Saccharomonospora amisosensis]